MLGNAIKSVMGPVIGTMLTRTYSMLYRPEDMVSVFTEFDEYIVDLFSDGWFDTVFAGVRAIGLGLLTASFLISLMDSVTDGDFTINNFFRHWLRFFMLYIILFYSMDIFEYLLQLTSDIVSDMSSSLSMSLGIEINQDYLTTGLNRYLEVMEELSIFMRAIIPYVVSCLFSIILYFFAISRLFEITIRVAMSPLVVGISYFVNGLHSDFVRYIKRTMGVFFQIVVVLIISLGLTVTHNALIESNSATSATKIGNPAALLVTDTAVREINVDGTWKKADATTVSGANEIAYTEESIVEFSDKLLDSDTYFVSAGIMLSGLFMIFKSRQIATEVFE